MSGPSLKKRDAHSSIHEAALNEAKELTNLFWQCLDNKNEQKAIQVADILIEHWETRTLRHAEAEEEGLYREMVSEHPELQETVIQLTRDHDLLRRIVEQLKDRLLSHTADKSMAAMFESLIIIDEIHNEDEVSKLLRDD